MLDTKGPELRIRTFKNHKITLKEGDTFTFTTEEIEGDQSKVSVSYKGIVNDLEPGDTVLLNNGLLIFKSPKSPRRKYIPKSWSAATCRIKKACSSRENAQPHIPQRSGQERYLFGIEQGIDFIACSFTSKAQDILDIRKLLEDNGNPDIDLIAKIESQSGVNNIDEILEASNGIMVARGDLGVEVPYEELPQIPEDAHQQMPPCEQALHHGDGDARIDDQPARPTRAEISDVANAVYDGTSAVMLRAKRREESIPFRQSKRWQRSASKPNNTLKQSTAINAPKSRAPRTRFRIPPACSPKI